MKRTLHFKVGISIEYDDEKSLRLQLKRFVMICIWSSGVQGHITNY